jgi:hypothetical protein
LSSSSQKADRPIGQPLEDCGGAPHPRYIQPTQLLGEEKDSLEDWGGELGSHLPWKPDEEGQAKPTPPGAALLPAWDRRSFARRRRPGQGQAALFFVFVFVFVFSR